MNNYQALMATADLIEANPMLLHMGNGIVDHGGKPKCVLAWAAFFMGKPEGRSVIHDFTLCREITQKYGDESSFFAHLREFGAWPPLPGLPHIPQVALLARALRTYAHLYLAPPVPKVAVKPIELPVSPEMAAIMKLIATAEAAAKAAIAAEADWARQSLLV